MRTIERTGQFKRDYKRESRGRQRAHLDAGLARIIETLANDQPLEARHHDQRRREPHQQDPPRQTQREALAGRPDDAAVGRRRLLRSGQGVPGHAAMPPLVAALRARDQRLGLGDATEVEQVAQIRTRAAAEFQQRPGHPPSPRRKRLTPKPKFRHPSPDPPHSLRITRHERLALAIQSPPLLQPLDGLVDPVLDRVTCSLEAEFLRSCGDEIVPLRAVQVSDSK